MAQTLSEILKNGFNGQSLCSKKCSDCTNRRQQCPRCCEIDHKNVSGENWEQKICATCWNNVCMNCSSCKSRRTRATAHHINKYLLKLLGSSYNSNQMDNDQLIDYMKELLKKQSDDAQIAV